MSDLGEFENEIVDNALSGTRPGPYSNKGGFYRECECGDTWRTGRHSLDGCRLAPEPSIRERVNRACAEIGREVGYRRSCYPKWVNAGRMTQQKADEQIAALEDAATLLRELSGVKR